ncbi:hypothetical protein TVAG_276740 [Trichomonas vaginalis G3]|uniref:Ankyrin repeat protein n=1 Tax=Trichomonas vaginalis (strain ATCC PRA-98 / G3) TaxID=412133 RepID=A2FFE3_TRIV3|nr:spectrin binding [Trichomonas vaginalis G3]EAX96389.1 hypothetical protein TVAG_276740 [Trichomonas vaginalis G3]KAI5545334.1 spectrin binding [Trichomonas vaginalis G3]|eukprot:XP_001309319.1 hypothetical protein [Trichomonas vaginalis G3]
MIQKASEEGLWEKKTKKYTKNNVLHIACKKGNLGLVKSLINCNKEAKDNNGYTPLIYASIL